ncbi:MAG: hypothetical protein ACTSVE_09645 [Candidatus Helarchaeota archaeon]
MSLEFLAIIPFINNLLNDFERERPHDPINAKHVLMFAFMVIGAVVFFFLLITGIIDYFQELEFNLQGIRGIVR